MLPDHTVRPNRTLQQYAFRAVMHTSDVLTARKGTLLLQHALVGACDNVQLGLHLIHLAIMYCLQEHTGIAASTYRLQKKDSAKGTMNLCCDVS